MKPFSETLFWIFFYSDLIEINWTKTSNKRKLLIKTEQLHMKLCVNTKNMINIMKQFYLIAAAKRQKLVSGHSKDAKLKLI